MQDQQDNSKRDTKAADLDQFQRFDANKDWFLVVPVLGSMLAVTFDVGYFWGTDLNYFTLFSLAEHVLFSFQALPVALMASTAAAAAILMSDTLNIRRQTTKLETSNENSTPGNRKKSITKLLWWLWLVAATVLAGVYIYRGLWGVAIAAVLMIIGIALIYYIPEVTSSKRAILGYIMVSCLIVAFAEGFYSGQRYLVGNNVLHTLAVKDGDIEGRTVRSGERGVLFFGMPDRKLLFIRWDEIKRISDSKPR